MQTTIYLLTSAIIFATNSLGLAQAQSNGNHPIARSAGKKFKGGTCDSSFHSLVCQDQQLLLFCPFGKWVKLSKCPAGTVCQSGSCVSPSDNALSAAFAITNGTTSSAPPTTIISSQLTSIPSPSAKANGYGKFGMDCAKFSQAVVAAGGNQPTNSQCAGFLAGIPNGGFTTARELAMFLANVLHESGNLQYKEEIACHKNPNSCKNSYRSSCDVPGKTYWGRGYMQLTWCYNYKAASMALYNNLSSLDNPEQVATNEVIAWNVSFWYWMANVHNSIGVQEGKFGASINAINPRYECGLLPSNQEEAQNRKDIYAKVLPIISPGQQPDNSGC